jgi:16S rRNA (cytosine1402-N4)-methyltransferase
MLTNSKSNVITGPSSHHLPVMVNEVMALIDSSFPSRSALFESIIDGTVGGGGHAEVLLQRLSPSGRISCFDRDPAALELARGRLAEDPRATFLLDSYANILRYIQPSTAEIILLDLGLSTDQLLSDRGFSYMRDTELNMRFDQEKEQNAFNLINFATKDHLRDVFFRYGEEPLSPRIASRIIEFRLSEPIKTTLQLADIIRGTVPERFAQKALSRIFQAIRIEINAEIEQLEKGLDACWDALKKGGMICILTYHSLEDRRVKRFFAAKSKGCICPPTLPICICGRKPEAKIIKPVLPKPSPKEIRLNPAARSARLRTALKIETSG